MIKRETGETGLGEGFAIVVDMGKTLSKVSLWSRDGRMLDRVTRPNARVDGGRTLDTRANETWLRQALARYAEAPVDYIVPVAHGAAVAGVRDGALAFSPPDYEQELPPGDLAAYRAERDAFAISGSPALPAGLNLGAQLDALDREAALEGVTLMPYAQYWAWFLSGAAVSEVTTLGCHSDLWAPLDAQYSPLARRRGWAAKFAPLAPASAVVGTLRPELARETGLSPEIRVLAGLHDSNAALVAARGFAQIDADEATVLSTGTWFVAMRITDATLSPDRLAEDRDCLFNVDVRGRPVPSARFMGGREIETLIELDTRRVDIKPDQPHLLAAVPGLLATGAMVLPSFAPGTGPFPGSIGRWINRPDDWFARRAAACLYAALVADAAIAQIGARERLLIEGRFAEAQVFVRALAALRPDMAVYVANAHNDVGLGALRLIDPEIRAAGELERVAPLEGDLAAYRDRWARAIEGDE